MTRILYLCVLQGVHQYNCIFKKTTHIPKGPFGKQKTRRDPLAFPGPPPLSFFPWAKTFRRLAAHNPGLHNPSLPFSPCRAFPTSRLLVAAPRRSHSSRFVASTTPPPRPLHHVRRRSTICVAASPRRLPVRFATCAAARLSSGAATQYWRCGGREQGPSAPSSALPTRLSDQAPPPYTHHPGLRPQPATAISVSGLPAMKVSIYTTQPRRVTKLQHLSESLSSTSTSSPPEAPPPSQSKTYVSFPLPPLHLLGLCRPHHQLLPSAILGSWANVCCSSPIRRLR
jgi:hypothetical protein